MLRYAAKVVEGLEIPSRKKAGAWFRSSGVA